MPHGINTALLILLKKDGLSFGEIKYISPTHFSNLLGPPTAEVLTKKFPPADKYDVKIRG
jgi:hypothetical protein